MDILQQTDWIDEFESWFFDGIDIKTNMLVQFDCSEEELNDALDDWLDLEIENDYSQHDSWFDQ